MPTERDGERLAAYGSGALVTAGPEFHEAKVEIAVYVLEDGSGRLELRRFVTDELVAVPMTTALTAEVQRVLDAMSDNVGCACF